MCLSAFFIASEILKVRQESNKTQTIIRLISDLDIDRTRKQKFLLLCKNAEPTCLYVNKR